MYKYTENYDTGDEGFHAARRRLEQLRRDPRVINAWFWANEPYVLEQTIDEKGIVHEKLGHTNTIIYYTKERNFEDD